MLKELSNFLQSIYNLFIVSFGTMTSCCFLHLSDLTPISYKNLTKFPFSCSVSNYFPFEKQVPFVFLFDWQLKPTAAFMMPV